MLTNNKKIVNIIYTRSTNPSELSIIIIEIIMIIGDNMGRTNNTPRPSRKLNPVYHI